MSRTPSVVCVENPIRDYAWGSLTAIPELLGEAPSRLPQAEMWLGAHPEGSSLLPDGSSLEALLAREPALLGDSQDHLGQLAFLMKVLAAASPLSLQVHPTRAQAEAGYARQDAAGIHHFDPRRTFKDRHHKPELVLAVTEFRTLSGFRDPGQTAALLADVLGEDAKRGLGHELIQLLGGGEPAPALRSALTVILSGRPEVQELVLRLTDRAARAAGELAESIRLVADHHPGDPGILAATLLNRADLRPGEALFLAAGQIHAYLDGVAIEAMAPSDNVVRGGLTKKYVDVAGLLDVVRFEATQPCRIAPEVTTHQGVTVTSFRPPVSEFSVHILDVDGGPVALPEFCGPSLILATEGGPVTVGAGADTVTLGKGMSAFHGAGAPLHVSSDTGPGRLYLTTKGQAAGTQGG